MSADGSRAGAGNGDVLHAKVCLLGDARVGKTSLVRRFVVGAYDERYVATLGASVTRSEVPVSLPDREVLVVLSLWDVMGEPTFRDLLRDVYFHGVRGILAVADLTRTETILRLPPWVRAAHELAGPVPLVLLGNKEDLPPAPGADAALRELANAFGVPVWRTSARTGAGVEAAFAAIARSVAEAEVARGEPGDSARPKVS